MDTANEILRALGRIEGELVEIRKLSERVSKLELWQSWLKGGWAAPRTRIRTDEKRGYQVDGPSLQTSSERERVPMLKR